MKSPLDSRYTRTINKQTNYSVLMSHFLLKRLLEAEFEFAEEPKTTDKFGKMRDARKTCVENLKKNYLSNCDS